MSDYWKNLERDGGGRWIEDDVPNQREKDMTRTKKLTEDEKATDQREIQTGDGSDSSTNSDTGSGTDAGATGPDGFGPEDAHTDVTDDPHASDSDVSTGYTGISGTAFPGRPVVEQSDVTETVTNDAGTEYEQPKYISVRDERAVRISPYGWVGPEALTVPLGEIDDFKKFVASL